MDITRLARESNELLDQLADRIPPDQFEICRDHATGGEWGEMIDNMFAVLVKRGIPVSPAERDALAELLDMYPTPLEDYDYINNRDQTLAGLHVQD